MVTRLKTKDLPQPWHSSKKSLVGMQGQKSSLSQVSLPEDTAGQNVQAERKKRGRPSGNTALKVAGAPKGMKKTRALPPSAINVLLSVSQTSVADVEELRRKRKEDAEACRRVVRNVSPLSRRKSIPTMFTQNCNEDDGNNDARAEDTKGKELAIEDADRDRPSCKRKEEFRGREWERVDVDSDFDDYNREQRSQQEDHGCSPTQKYSREVYKDRQLQFGDGFGQGHRSYRQRSDKSLSRSPRRNMYESSRHLQSLSPQRSDSRSPARRSGRRWYSVGHEYDDYGYDHYQSQEYHNHDGFYKGDHCNRPQFESSSTESYQRRRRSCSNEPGFRIEERNRTSYSHTSPPSRSPTYQDVMAKERLEFYVLKKDNRMDNFEASKRRQRRHEQKFFNSQKSKRQKEGKTPFYLMLDREGKPYGPGRPSWLAEVNKLARGLDPSCTHIRKQTFEDIQTFKDRLEERFEYSRPLNEDYLRALMGRVVTKRRTEIITFIKNGGKQPKHMDEEVWKRLEKLASSEQREQKSEQGHHANACRRVVARTGRLGIDGVRAKLHSLLGRSPDPSEIEEEMHRDKGYGGRKKKSVKSLVNEDSTSAEVIPVEEEMQSRRISIKSSELHNNPGNEEAIDYHLVPVRVQRLEDVEEVDGGGATTEYEHESFIDAETNEMTKDEYIEKLKAEMKLLHKEKAKTRN